MGIQKIEIVYWVNYAIINLMIKKKVVYKINNKMAKKKHRDGVTQRVDYGQSLILTCHVDLNTTNKVIIPNKVI